MPSDIDPPKAIPYIDWGIPTLPGAIKPLDFSDWILRQFPWAFQQPGPVWGQKGTRKGKPVPPPGNPPEKGGSAIPPENPIQLKNMPSWLQFLWPTAGQRRDFAVYGLALIVFVIAVAAILK